MLKPTYYEILRAKPTTNLEEEIKNREIFLKILELAF